MNLRSLRQWAAAAFASNRQGKPEPGYTSLHNSAVQALRQGDYPLAESAARQALAVALKLPQPRNQPVLTSAVLLTSALVSMRRWEDALAAAREALHQVPSPANDDDATGLVALHKCCADCLLELSRLPEAIEAASHCAHHALQGNLTARILHQEIEADIASHQGDYPRLLTTLQTLETLLTTSPANANPHTLRSLYLRQATAYRDTFRPALAIPLLDKALALPDCYPLERGALLNLKGVANDECEQHQEALALHQAALQLIQQHLPAGDPRIALPHILLGQSCANSGQIAAASAALAAAEIHSAELDETESQGLLQLRGLIALTSGHYDDAEAHFRQSLHWAEQSSNPHHPRLVNTLANLAAALQKQGRTEEAAAFEARRQSIRSAYPDLP